MNNKKEIMRYLGKSAANKLAWRKTRSEYGQALHYLAQGNRVWTTSEALDGVDIARSLTVVEALELKRGDVWGGAGVFGGRMPPELLKLRRQILPELPRGK